MPKEDFTAPDVIRTFWPHNGSHNASAYVVPGTPNGVL
ncbi:hypothetical protein AtDm6_3274 [Acetobacter tropicalis]|uniref:Uncharacterized protein n=1 Tax=Acetobacter tropicalis TaxID=104102 RepID=A0A094YJW0_9PROT|nr:hypothetical protein AtDm6_3274 [Acetobacter tropicalis]